MANPLLNDKAFSKAVERTPDQAGWAAPKGGSATDAPTTWNAPITDGPVSPWRSANPMTANGAMSATLFLMVLLVGAATYGWSSVQTIGVGEAVSFPSWAMIAFIVGFVSVLVATFKPTTARFLAPVYALAQGAVVGAISKVFNIQYPGIVLQAVGATIGVFVVMLTLYRTGILRVTDKFRRIVIG
ncbi:MAG: Bax inhibitor-1/YccA family protein, partial [Ilumatobacteraceae bacterium]|nr:Bax inhibitor-1/YccA family protein [Ilumatobacteraceae bacterium]